MADAPSKAKVKCDFEGNVDASDALKAVVKNTFRCGAIRLLSELVERHCESPLEAPMLLALVGVAGFHEACRQRDCDRADEIISQAMSSGAGQIDHANAIGLINGAVICVPQLSVRLADREYRLDYAFLSSGGRLCIEFDGHSFHERTPEQASRDRARDRQLQIAGWTVLRYTYSEVVKNFPSLFNDQIYPQIERLVPPRQETP